MHSGKLTDHFTENEKPTKAHLRVKIIKLGEAVNDKTLIYLDTRYWLFLRDAALNRAKKPIHYRLLSKFKELVLKNKILCPLSETIFIELMKQKDNTTLMKTAATIDELSAGLCLAPYYERIGAEIDHYIHSFFYTKEEIDELDKLIWVKSCYVLGKMYPYYTDLDEQTESAIQKAFIDFFWEHTLVELLDNSKGSPKPPDFDYSAIVNSININNPKHAGDFKSFKEAYLIEFIGVLEAEKNELANSITRLAIKKYPELATQKANIAELEDRAFNFFANLFTHTNQMNAIPTLHILAMCHAAVRWNSGHQLKANDIPDFHHAAAATRYCDAFFTDNPLKTLLTQKHVALDKEFDCTIISDETSALKYLEQIR